MKRGGNDQDIIICRCRDVTEEEIKQAIEDGFDTMELLKRKTKIGTGTCGGRPVCGWLNGSLPERPTGV